MSNRAERRRQERQRGRHRDGGGGGDRHRPDTVPVARVVVLAVALALVAAALEVAVVFAVRRWGPIVRLSDHYTWMVPAAHVMAFLAVAGLLLALGLVWPRARGRPVTVGVLAGLLTVAVVGMLEPLYPLAVLILAAGVGAQAGRAARGRFGHLLVRAAPATAASLGVVFLALAATAFTAPRRTESRALAGLPAAGDRPNILLVVMDAVRAQSMGLYNPSLDNTPVLSALADQSTVFDRASAPSPWTLPTHATLFTGRWPTEHLADWHRALDGRFPTLAERLAEAGYATAGFTGNLVFTGPEQGLARGFARYRAYPVNLAQVVLSTSLGRRLASLETPRRWVGLGEPLNEVPAEEITDRFLRWRDRLQDRPYFVFLNYYDAHEPFPPAPGGPPITPQTHRHSLFSGTVSHFEAPGPAAEDRFLQGYLAGYQAAIGYIDREILRLLRALDERGDLNGTVLVVTSDHGEVIGEHRLVGHNSSLYHPNLWVPLLIRYPASVPTGLRVADEVSIRHLPATLLDMAGVPGSGIPGRSLAPLLSRSRTEGAWQDTLYAHLTGGSGFPPWAPAALGAEMHSLIRDRYHYILNGDGSEELYHLEHDPGELRNLAPETARMPLLEELRRLLRSVPGAEPLPGPAGRSGPRP